MQDNMNCWSRIQISDSQKLQSLKKTLGIDIELAIQSNLNQDGKFAYYPIQFMSHQDNKTFCCRVIFILGENILISLEPEQSPLVLEQMTQKFSLELQQRSIHQMFAAILQSINDASDQLLDSLNDDLGEILVLTSSVLNSLESKDRDFGASDVVSTQADLGLMEELLSDCIESQLQLALVARHVQARIPQKEQEIKQLYQTLIEDIEAVEEHVSFVHDRIRLLQATNNMALNVKQNQIVKVFSVITAVFLPAMLISTYYSMNFDNMPALQLEYAEPITIALTLTLAILPLIYVKQRGWLR